jgi:PAS domain S-box-containing protein
VKSGGLKFAHITNTHANLIMFSKIYKKLIARIATIGIQPNDNKATITAKNLLVFLAILMSFGGIMWGTILLAFDIYLPMVIPYGYVVLSFLNILYFHYSNKFEASRVFQIIISMLLPFGLQWMLGGFFASGVVMLWAVLALIGSITLLRGKNAYQWLIFFISLTLFSLWLEPHIVHFKPAIFTSKVSVVLIAINILTIISIVFVLSKVKVDKDLVIKNELAEAYDQLNQVNQENIQKHREIALKNDELRTSEEELLQSQEELRTVNTQLELHRQKLEEKVAQRTQKLQEKEKALQQNLEALKNSQIEQQKLALMLDNTDDFVVLFSLDGQILYINKSGKAMRGIDDEVDINTLKISDFEVVEDSKVSLMQDVVPYVKQHKQWVGELVQKNIKDDDKVDVHTSVFPVVDNETNEWLCLAMIQRDITLQKAAQAMLIAQEETLRHSAAELEVKVKQLNEAQEEMKEAKDTAERANDAKTQFLANMSHEIRSPLNAIVGFSQILIMRSKHMQMELEDKQYLENIKMSGENLSELINNILDLSKIEAGKLTKSIEAINIKQLFKAIFHINKANAMEKELNFVYDFDDHIPELISSDRTKINQILMNLTSNAIKFTPKGKTVSIVAKKIPKQQTILFEIKDEGIGIAAERLPHIFKPFEQADNSVTRKFGGTGLGLTITRKMIELLGGSIEVQSTEGKGSTFSVTLPYDTAIEQEISKEHYNIEGVVFKPENKVLVVEDNKLNQDMMQAVFQELGLTFYLAENGEEGVKKAQELQPDLILMDMHMPVLDGLGATRKIKAIDELAAIPIVAVSADAFTQQQRKAFDVGVSEYITKPIDFDKLLPIFVKYLKKEGTEGEANQTEGKVLSPELLQQIEEKLELIQSTPIFETKQIVGYINEIRQLSDGYAGSYHQLCDSIEDAVFAGDEELLQESLKNLSYE